MYHKAALHYIVLSNFLQRVDILKGLSVTVRGEEMLDYFKHEQNLTDSGNVVDEFDIRRHVHAECDAAPNLSRPFQFTYKKRLNITFGTAIKPIIILNTNKALLLSVFRM